MASIPNKSFGDFSMPVYGMGTWEMGGRRQADPDNDDAADLLALKTAMDEGITHIDTAEGYGAGAAERLVGKAIKNFDRSSLTVVSKVGPEHLSPSQVQQSIKRSLTNLDTDYLDVYMVHSWSSIVPIDETMDALCWLVDEGLVRHIAVSNFTVERFEAAQAVSRHKIVANQLHYNLQIREVEKAGLLDYCQKNDVALVAWGPVQKGMLDFEASVLQEVAKHYGKTPTQVAINWLTSQPAVVTLSKTRSLDHLRENIAATDWQMKDEHIELLRREMPGQADISNRVPLDY